MKTRESLSDLKLSATSYNKWMLQTLMTCDKKVSLLKRKMIDVPYFDDQWKKT